MEERTFTVPAKRGEPLEIMVNADENDDASDVYTYTSDMADLPAVLHHLGWEQDSRNAAFIHCRKPQQAYQYIRHHALDADED